ncbi:MFS general substrate transporter [Obba rivulosa]|uniref:MFS general substrate transporter n=1 Tax=Obba rivulosa TaxID=1052685 RepID=A0A8E2ARH8_9APHY|nr:MFS general substrate transporter [Obba rivulosa]
MAPDDPDNPQTWSRLYRWYLTAISGVLALNATFASSAPSGIFPSLQERFTLSDEVATLTISLFVAGYCVGPLLWGPLSEQFGRRPIFILTFFVYTVFQVGCALAPNTAGLLVFRFIGGTFAAAPLSNSGALIADIWDADTRGKAMAIFTLAPFAGPALAPGVSGFMEVAGVPWQWIFWLLAIFAGTCLVVIVFTVPETYVPVLLVRRAQKRRKETGEERWWAPMEKQKLTFSQHMQRILARPFQVLFQEPMLIAITVYMSFVYGCVYILFEAFPIVFTEGHHFNLGISGLMFLPMLLGGTAGVIIYLLIFNPIYTRKHKLVAPNPVPPEARLDIAMWAGPMYALSFFWFGWTSFPSVSYWAPLISILPMALSVGWIFLALINYIVDTYLFVAASALAANTVVRSIFGAGFPLFATQMFEKLDPRWASTVLGCVALLLAPIPFVLHRYGPALRKRSKYSPTGGMQAKPTKGEDQA